MGVISKSPVLIEFYYDVVSPYSWLAFEVLCRYKSIWNIELKLKPFYQGGIMNLTDNRPPGTVPNKAVYIERDLKKMATLYQVPVSIPENLPSIIYSGKGTLYTQRFITAVDMKDPSQTENLSRAFWERIFEEHKDFLETQSLIETAKKAGINDTLIKHALEAMKDTTIKERLTLYTQEAADRKAFGSPSIVAHLPEEKPHLFFGCDRMELLAHCLGEKWMSPCPAVFNSDKQTA